MPNAANNSGETVPSGLGGVVTAICLTPATFAKVAVIITVDTSGTLPPGT